MKILNPDESFSLITITSRLHSIGENHKSTLIYFEVYSIIGNNHLTNYTRFVMPYNKSHNKYALNKPIMLEDVPVKTEYE